MRFLHQRSNYEMNRMGQSFFLGANEKDGCQDGACALSNGFVIKHCA